MSIKYLLKITIFTDRYNIYDYRPNQKPTSSFQHNRSTLHVIYMKCFTDKLVKCILKIS